MTFGNHEATSNNVGRGNFSVSSRAMYESGEHGLPGIYQKLLVPRLAGCDLRLPPTLNFHVSPSKRKLSNVTGGIVPASQPTTASLKYERRAPARMLVHASDTLYNAS